MMFQAVLSNREHPEYGVVSIPFPISSNYYARGLEALAPLEIGDVVKADCMIAGIDSAMGPAAAIRLWWKVMPTASALRAISLTASRKTVATAWAGRRGSPIP